MSIAPLRHLPAQIAKKVALLKGLKMTQKFFALSFGLLAIILMTQASQAAPQCGPRAAVLEKLTNGFGETRRSMGIAVNNMVMEVFASAETQSWTITITTPQGQTCLVASGHGFEALAEQLPAKGEPA
jgi:hypothetical protein